MKKIPSFTVDHIRLQRGIFVSRKDEVGGEIVTTFDIRMKEPNREPALGPAAIHTIEHLAATFLRNHPVWADKITCASRTVFPFKIEATKVAVNESPAPTVSATFTFGVSTNETLPGVKT